MADKRRLTKINTIEVSLVGKAANNRKFLVTKADHLNNNTDDNTKDNISVSDLFTKVFNVSMTLPEIMKQTQYMGTKEADEFFSKIQKSAPLKDLLLGLSELQPDILKKSLTSLTLLTKSKDTRDFISTLKTDLPGDFMDRRVDDFEKDLDKLGNESLDLLKTIVNMLNDFFNRGVKPGDSTFTPKEDNPMVEKSIADEISKLPENIQKHITSLVEKHTKVEKSYKSANDELSKLKNKDIKIDPMSDMTDIQKSYFKKQEAKLTLLEKAADENETVRYISKADSYGLPGVTSDSFGLVLKEINSKCSEETSKIIMKTLSDLGDIISKSELLKPIGADGEPTLSDNETKLAEKAKAIQKSDNCTHEIAISKALEQNPELYDE